MTYSVKEIFLTLQGEGANAGRVAVFCRFAGCNLWSGREADRASAVCRFCDTDFVGTDGTLGGKYPSANALAAQIAAQWPHAQATPAGQRLVVLTGGEPLLQVDAALIAALHAHGFEIAVETNGTVAAPAGLDWVCVSPKMGSSLLITLGWMRRPWRRWPPCPSPTTCCKRWMARMPPATASTPSPCAWPIRVGGCRCRRTSSWASAKPLRPDLAS